MPVYQKASAVGPNYYFLAADQYKIKIGDFETHYKEDGMLTSPRDVVGWALFEVIEWLGVPPTLVGYDADAEDTYRDRWVGDGAGVLQGDVVRSMRERMEAARREAEARGQAAAVAPHTGDVPQRKDKPGSGVRPVETMPLKP